LLTVLNKIPLEATDNAVDKKCLLQYTRGGLSVFLDVQMTDEDPAREKWKADHG